MIILDIDKPERCGKCPMHHDGNDYCKLAHDHASFVRAKGCPIQTIKTGHCKDCKWWKDSDGAFRRGIGAESKCPINRREVFEGNGYCYMFEPQGSEG